jgi:hypothetical protein
MPVPEPIRERIRLLVTEHGVVGASQLLGIGQRACERALAGLGVRAGTETLIRQRLDMIDGGR